MKTRPRLKPTQSVPVSLGARTVATMYWPGSLSWPKELSVDRFLPMATQSPQGLPERPEEFTAVGIQEGPAAAVILSTPHVLQPGEDGTADFRIVDDGNVEGARLARSRPRKEGIGNPVPAGLGRALEVDLNLRVKEGVEAVVGDGWVDAGLSAVAEYRHEPAAGVEGLGAIVLRAAHDVIERVLHVDRQALELERGKPLVHGEDCGGDRGQPVRAIGSVRSGQTTRRAIARGVGERAAQSPETTVVADKNDIGVEGSCGNRMLVRVQAHPVGIDGHVGEGYAVIGRALDGPPVRPPTEFGVLHGASDVDDVRSSGG